MNIPVVLTVISVGLLAVFFFRGRNAVWGGDTAGLIVGIVLGFIMGDFPNRLMWAFSVGTFCGVAAELIGKLGDRMRQSRY